MEVRSPFAGWVERDAHLIDEHEASERIVETLDSRGARDLHRWFHSSRVFVPDHTHTEF